MQSKTRRGFKYSILNSTRHIKYQRWNDNQQLISSIDLLYNLSHPRNKIIDEDNNPVVFVAEDMQQNFLEFIQEHNMEIKLHPDDIPNVGKIWDDYKLSLR